MTKSITPFKTEIRRIENLLQKITATQDTAQRCDHAITDIEEHATKIIRKPYPTDRTTTPIEANDPAPEAVDTNRSDVVTSSNPSSRTHRLEVPERPDRKPPDQR